MEETAPSPISEALQRTRLFADLPPHLMDKLHAVARERVYEDGECIIRRGEPCTGTLVIAEGCIETSRARSDGKCLLYDLSQPGQVMGTFGAFDGYGSPLDNTARGRTRVVHIPYGPLRKALQESASLAIALMAMTVRRNRLDFERMYMTLDSMRIRVAKFVLYLSRRPLPESSQSIQLPVRISQEDIAGLLGVSRASVNKELVEMVREGILDWHYGSVVIQNLDKLMAVVTECDPLFPEIEGSIFARSTKYFPASD